MRAVHPTGTGAGSYEITQKWLWKCRLRGAIFAISFTHTLVDAHRAEGNLHEIDRETARYQRSLDEVPAPIVV